MSRHSPLRIQPDGYNWPWHAANRDRAKINGDRIFILIEGNQKIWHYTIYDQNTILYLSLAMCLISNLESV